MSIIYGAFCVAVGIVIALNFLIRSKNEKVDQASIPWLFMGAAYFGMFIVMAINNTTTPFNIFLFQILSTIGLFWYARVLEFRFFFISTSLSVGLPLFVTAWTIMAYITDMSTFSVLLPSTVSMTVIAFIIAVYYFIRSDEEVLLKNVVGGLFTAFGLCKILYIIDTEIQEPIFYIGLFVLDYVIYLIISFLLFFNIHYKKINYRNRQFTVLKEIINYAPAGYVNLNRSGDIIYANDHIEGMLRKAGITQGTIYDLFDLFPVIDRFYYQVEWKRIVVALDMRQRYFKSKEIYGDSNYEIQFDFHLVDIRSTNEPEIFLNISFRELDMVIPEVPLDQDFVDAVTGLPSKTEMQKAFEKRLVVDREEKFAIILMSIANYKEMVKYVGSELAEEFMAVLNTYIEEVDQIDRIGKISADTFELFTKSVEEEQVADIVNDLILNLQIPFKHKDYDIETKPLLGIAMYPDNGITHGELLRGAQIALARAEHTRTGQIQYCDIEFMKAGAMKLDIENRLFDALKNKEFHLLFQPQYDAAKEIFRGFEALIRWNCDEEENISPNLFIPIAEELGIMEEIGRWVLREAVKKAVYWQKKYNQTFIMSVNISSLQLEERGFSDYVKQVLDEFGYKPEFLELEITENRLIRSSEDVFRELREVKRLGVKIALDDFGTGYSSLDYLRWLPFDVLKIDKSFIDNLNDDSIEREIVHSVIKLVNRMNLETVAEGVENTEQLRSLQASSCTYIQGYLFSKPLNDQEVEGILLKYTD